MQAGLDGSEVCLPGAEAVVQLLPLLLAKRAVCAVAEGAETENKVKVTSYSKNRCKCFEIIRNEVNASIQPKKRYQKRIKAKKRGV